MKITGIEVRRFRADAKSPDSPEIVVVDVATDEEIVGTGYASAPPRTGAVFAAIIRDVLTPEVLGENPILTEHLWQRMYKARHFRGGEGYARLCTAALDFALWDIKAKRAGVPLWQLFGGHRPRVPTYANCAHHMAPDALAERAAEYVRRGHRALKIRGTRTFVTPREATERVKQVRAAVGPDVRLLVDVNGSWDADTAIQQLKAWEAYDVYWLEEPVPPQDIPGYARVRERAGRTYIVGGEQHAGLLEFRPLILDGRVDFVQPNAAVTGGITDWLRVHAFASAHGVPVSPWNLQLVHLHMAAGLANVQWIEYFMADNALMEFQIRLFKGPRLREEVTEEGVALLAPEGLGLGLELDPEVAERALLR